MPSTEITFMFLVAVLTILILLVFLQLIQERQHWLKPVGIRISIAKFDVDGGVCIYLT